MSRLQSPLQSTGVFSPPESDERSRRIDAENFIIRQVQALKRRAAETAQVQGFGGELLPQNPDPAPLPPAGFSDFQDDLIRKAQALKAEAARTATLQNRVGMTGVLPEGLMQIVPPGAFPGQPGTRDRLPDGGPSGLPSPAPGALSPAAVDAPSFGGSIFPGQDRPKAFVSAGQAADPRADAAGDTIVNQQSQATQDLLDTLRARPKIGDTIAAQHEMFGPPTLPPELLAQIEQEGLANQGIARAEGGGIEDIGFQGARGAAAGQNLQRLTPEARLRQERKGLLDSNLPGLRADAAQRPFGVPSDDDKAKAIAAFRAREAAAGRGASPGGVAAGTPTFNTFGNREDERVEEAFGDAAEEQQGERQGGINIRRLMRRTKEGLVVRSAVDPLSIQLGATDENLRDAGNMADAINDREKTRQDRLATARERNAIKRLSPEAQRLTELMEAAGGAEGEGRNPFGLAAAGRPDLARFIVGQQRADALAGQQKIENQQRDRELNIRGDEAAGRIQDRRDAKAFVIEKQLREAGVSEELIQERVSDIGAGTKPSPSSGATLADSPKERVTKSIILSGRLSHLGDSPTLEKLVGVFNESPDKFTAAELRRRFPDTFTLAKLEKLHKSTQGPFQQTNPASAALIMFKDFFSDPLHGGAGGQDERRRRRSKVFKAFDAFGDDIHLPPEQR